MVNSAKIIRVPLECPLAPANRGAMAVIGNLDGIHLGHQELVYKAVAIAEKAGAPAAVVVFDPHPRKVFQPSAPPFILTQIETKARLLYRLGIDLLYVLPFNDQLRTQTPETFVKHTLGEIMGLSGMITGTDFRFGAGRSGDVKALMRLATEAGMTAHAIEPVIAPGGEKFSSSNIRQALREGHPEEAVRMLDRPFAIRGEVIEGKKLARTLDFPTANISLGDYVRPKYGVYAVTLIHDDQRYPGVANIGVRPTVGGATELLEVHMFQFEGDLYGETVEVELHSFLRPEEKFDGLDALKAQIAKDTADARQWHKTHTL